MVGYRFRKALAASAAAALLAVSTMLGSGVAVAAGGAGLQANLNPGVVPNRGNQYIDLAAKWWLWAYSFPAATVPFLVGGGAVDISAGQHGNVWFLAGTGGGTPVTRTGTVPTGVQLFLPLANFVNDYPCPDPTFQPDPGESLEHFLVRTGTPFLVGMTNLFAEIDGVKLRDLDAYLAISHLFTFTADPALAATVDPCITGTPQQGVSMGYWLLLTPFTPGVHTLHFGSEGVGQDITYQITVQPGARGH